MSKKSIQVFFKGQEKTIEIDLQEYNTYESFLKKINQEFNRTNTYQLMGMNTSEQYIILNSENYLKILNEPIEGGLKLFMSEMVKDFETMNKNTENNKGEKPETVEEEDDDFVIENTQINEEINKINDITNNEEGKEKKDENNEENKDNKEESQNEKEEDKNKYYMNDNLFKSMRLNNSSNPNNNNNNKEELFNINSFFNVSDEDENDLYKNKYILKSPIIQQDLFNTEKCHICESPLHGIKYVCCICENYIICEECELYHNHPCFKYKRDFISNIVDTSNFLEKIHGFKPPYESTGYSKLFRKEYDLKILPLSDFSFSLRPNKKIFIPIKILNYCRETIKSSQFVIICKNQKNIFLSTNENEKYSIEPGGEYILKIKCITPERTCKTENISIEIFSNELNIKSSRRLSYEYNIEVNFDSEDDKINMELKNDDVIYCFNKDHKKLALKFMKLHNCEYKVNNIFSSLFENNWDHTRALKALKKKK